jgi:8-oxo-dGTP diphosphatase
MMDQKQEMYEFVNRGDEHYMAHISIDSVIFGFHANQLKVLLVKIRHDDRWALPGGFVRKEETMEEAADRVLSERTGLNNIFLRQFHVFSDIHRSNTEKFLELMRSEGIEVKKNNWLTQRFISVGFYALVNYEDAIPSSNWDSEVCEWFDLQNVGELILDHNKIIESALETMRRQLNFQPIGYNLLPEKFTMPELQRLYETILGKTLDRRNFQRKMLGYGILDRLEERRKGGAHKAPYLYKFNLEQYQKALKEGLQGGW